jgi:hypothetical protein
MRKYIAGLALLVSACQAVKVDPMEERIWSAPTLRCTVEPGEDLTRYAAFEGIRGSRSVYMQRVHELNPTKVKQGSAIPYDYRISVKDTIIFPDVNRDSLVGTRELGCALGENLNPIYNVR